MMLFRRPPGVERPAWLAAPVGALAMFQVLGSVARCVELVLQPSLYAFVMLLFCLVTLAGLVGLLSLRRWGLVAYSVPFAAYAVGLTVATLLPESQLPWYGPVIVVGLWAAAGLPSLAAWRRMRW